MEGRASPVVTKYKSIPVPPSRKLPTISSSPHLVGICEEGEDGTSDADIQIFNELRAAGRSSPQTYSSIRMIRPRQAVVSPDVIRRYDKRVSSRSRRSTSCSSSEASDDEERRLSLIHTHHCRRRDRNNSRNNDDDSDPPAAGSSCGNASAVSGIGGAVASNGGQTTTNGKTKLNAGKRAQSTDDEDSVTETSATNSGAAKRHWNNERRPPATMTLDARKLASKLQKLALAPIREMPNLVLSKFGRGDKNSHLVDDTRRWFKPLSKPKSCEHLASPLTPDKSSSSYGDDPMTPPSSAPLDFRSPVAASANAATVTPSPVTFYEKFDSSFRLIDLKVKFRHKKKKKSTSYNISTTTPMAPNREKLIFVDDEQSTPLLLNTVDVVDCTTDDGHCSKKRR